jgi:hypothetical protein
MAPPVATLTIARPSRRAREGPVAPAAERRASQWGQHVTP